MLVDEDCALLDKAVSLGFMQDGRGDDYLIRYKALVKTLPQQFLAEFARMPYGVVRLGPKGPYIACRLLGLGKYDEELDAHAKKQNFLDKLEETCQGNAVRKAHCLQIAQFWVTDGAKDERNVGHLLHRDDAPNMKFRFVDDPHCKQTVLKHVFENDAELEELDHKLVKGERSLARYIQNSKRYFPFAY